MIFPEIFQEIILSWNFEGISFGIFSEDCQGLFQKYLEQLMLGIIAFFSLFSDLYLSFSDFVFGFTVPFGCYYPDVDKLFLRLARCLLFSLCS